MANRLRVRLTEGGRFLSSGVAHKFRSGESVVLVRKDASVRSRISIVVLRMSVVACGVLGFAYLISLTGVCDWPPQSSGPLGLMAGILVGLIVFFEMFMAPRKWLRGYRLLSAQFYLRWHIRLGFVSLPLVLIHSGFSLGGALPATVLLLFLAVFFSGVWGLILQQWLPTLLLDVVPEETIQAESSVQMNLQVLEVEQILAALLPLPSVGEISLQAEKAFALQNFGDTVRLYFRGGRTGSPLRSPSRAENLFALYQKLLPPTAQPALARLRRLVGVRRQWVIQSRIQFWLHNWLLVHLPLSVAMTILMVLHAVRALKYW